MPASKPRQPIRMSPPAQRAPQLRSPTCSMSISKGPIADRSCPGLSAKSPKSSAPTARPSRPSTHGCWDRCSYWSSRHWPYSITKQGSKTARFILGQLVWFATYEPGELTLLAKADGVVTARKAVRTAGTAAEIELAIDRSTLRANRSDAVRVEATLPTLRDGRGGLSSRFRNQRTRETDRR